MPYDIYLFDLDGTLTDPKLGITRSLQLALAAFGIHKDVEELIGHIGPPLRKTFMECYGLSEAESEHAVRVYREYFTVKGLYENTVYPGIPELLERLKGNKKQLAVVTAKPLVYTEKILAHFKLDGFFSFVAGDSLDGSLAKNGKAGLINSVLDKADPTRTCSSIMIGDRSMDVLGALEAGIDALGVLWGYGSKNELVSAGAKYIAATPQELCCLIVK